MSLVYQFRVSEYLNNIESSNLWKLYNSVQFLFSCSVVSNYLQPHGLQHTRLPCPSQSPWVCSNSCPLSRWCHPTISSSVVPFSSSSQSFPASESFPLSQLFTSGGQNIGVSASVLPMNVQDWFPLGFTGLIPLLSKELSRVLSSTRVWRHQFVSTQAECMTNGKTIALDCTDLCWQSNVSVF